MDPVTFRFEEKEYSGFVVCSKKIDPHYYWFICSDEELIDKLGEDVAFVARENTLHPLNYTLAEKHPDLFRQIIITIEQKALSLPETSM
jgi:hypothetical protein